ncbi:MAG TPA: hypothetical protein VIT93_03385 [Dehalococcoidia bacterium]
MTSARHPLPTDIVALVSFDGRVYPNEAKPLERLGPGNDKPHALETALEQWFSFATGKHTWVSVHGATIRGLISARPRTKRTAWEIEVLINTTDDDSVWKSLFARMLSGIGRHGAERIFLRVQLESPVRQAARDAGFFVYAEESLRRRPALLPPPQSDLPVRRKAKSESLAVFQLYSREVPANVRGIEGTTLREWQAAQEKWGGRFSDLVVENDGTISAWARVVLGQVNRLAALSDGGYDDIVSAALQIIGEREAHCLAPRHAPGLVSALDRLGFEPAGEFCVMAKRLAKPARELAPEAARDAIPAS